MTLRMLTGIAICCGAALSLICGTPRPEQLSLETEGRKIDISAGQSNPPNVTVHPNVTLQRSISSPATRSIPRPDTVDETDLASLRFDLGIARINVLEQGSSLQLTLPDDHIITLVPVRHEERDGTRVTTAHAGDLVTTITRRGESFFAAVASPYASYRVQGVGAHASAYRQRDLDMRSAFTAEDYRRVQ